MMVMMMMMVMILMMMIMMMMMMITMHHVRLVAAETRLKKVQTDLFSAQGE